MKKLLLISFFTISNLIIYAQPVDTLDYFYLNRSHMRLQDRYESSLSEDSKMKSRKYYGWLKGVVEQYYQFWDGSNEAPVMSTTKHEFSLKEDLGNFTTDYFEIHFAQQYMDLVYLDSMINNGKELFAKYIKLNAKNKRNDYVKVLNKVKAMLPENDFYLMFAFAEKLQKAICVVRINEEKNKFYIMLTERDRLSRTEYLLKTYKQLTSSEIPKDYVIQTEFELR